MTGPLAKELARRTNYAKTELRKLRSAFDEFDTDHSGDLNRIEFRKIICGLRLFPGASEEVLDTLFSSFDNDNSQSISFFELAAVLAVLSKASPEEKLLYMFEIYDKDGSGSLDPEEVMSIVQQMRIITNALGRDINKLEPFIKTLLEEGDLDDDGVISKMEWIQAARKSPGVIELLTFNLALAAPSPEGSPTGSPRGSPKGGKKKKDVKKMEKEKEKAKKEAEKRKKKRMKEVEKEDKEMKHFEAKPGDVKKQYEVKEKKKKGLFGKKS